MLRVNPNTSAAASGNAHNSANISSFLRAKGEKNRKAAKNSDTIMSWPPKVIQWLMNPVMRSPT